MNRNEDREKPPLASEQANRDNWRKGETILDEQDANGHSLPETERDGATSKAGKARVGPGGAAPPPD